MPTITPVINDGNVVDAVPVLKADSSHDGANKAGKGKSAVLHRSLHHDPVRVTSAKGHYLHLSNGQTIFDTTGGAAVACLGHGDERYYTEKPLANSY